jgi:hypothetical protein
MGFSTSDDRPIRSDSDISGSKITATVDTFDVTTELVVEDGETLTIQETETQTNSRVTVEGTLTVEGELTVTDSPAASYSAQSKTAEDIQTIGLFESDTDTLLALARLETPISSPSVELAIHFDTTDATKTTWVRQGLEFLSAVMADNVSSWPTKYAYGSGSANDPTINDTSLESQVVETLINEVVLQESDTTTEWENNTTISSTTPAEITNGELKSLQTCFVQECDAGLNNITRNDFSNGDGLQLIDDGQDTTPLTVGYDYTLEQDHIGVAARIDDQSTNTTQSDFNFLEIQSNGTKAGELFYGENDLDWYFGSWGTGTTSQPTELTGGEDIELVLREQGSPNSDVQVDLVVVFDTRFSYTFDNTVNEDQGYLDGPELYPDLNKIDADESTTLDNAFDTVRLNTSWNDTSNSQLIGVSADGSSYQEFSNTEDQTVTFGSDTNSAFARFGLSRYSPNGARNQTPRFGYESQAVDVATLTSVGQNIRPNEIGELRVQAQLLGSTAVGETFAEAGLKADDGTLLTRSLVPEFTKQSGQQVFSSEILRWQNEDSV